MRIIRVFPRRTKATPTDELAVVGDPRFFDLADEVHISVAFEWDMPEAERLAQAWRYVAPVKIGGPATGEPGGEFIPGMYLQHGYTITSRGCPNRCWFCSVPRREGKTVRELPIHPGHNVLDDNLLACSETHQRAVFDMLAEEKKKGHRIEFTGGLEAARLKPWHVERLRILRPKQMFFAYDTPNDLDPLRRAAAMLTEAGWTNSCLRCYVLCGWTDDDHRPGDTMAAAERRCREVLEAGMMPMAMLYRGNEGKRDRQWSRFQRSWARPAMIRGKAPNDPKADRREASESGE